MARINRNNFNVNISNKINNNRRYFTYQSKRNLTTIRATYVEKNGEYDLDDIIFSVKSGRVGVLIVWKDLAEFIERAKDKVNDFKGLPSQFKRTFTEQDLEDLDDGEMDI